METILKLKTLSNFYLNIIVDLFKLILLNGRNNITIDSRLSILNL